MSSPHDACVHYCEHMVYLPIYLDKWHAGKNTVSMIQATTVYTTEIKIKA